MNMTLRGRKRRAFTLVESIVMLGLFVIIVVVALSLVETILQYSSKALARRLAQQNLRLALGVVSSELRQAIADPDPGGSGYVSIVPTVAATGILTPNANSRTSNNGIVFTEPDSDHFDPSLTGWNSALPDNYRRIRYYVSQIGTSTQLRREETKFTPSGGVLGTSDALLIQSGAGGNLTLSAQWLAPDSIALTMSTQEGVSACKVTTTVNVLGK